MRFMMFMLPNIDPDADWMPSAEAVAEMTKYNQSLEQAGVLLAGEGLHPQTEGVRVAFSPEGATSVTDGPFTEAKEMIGGYWIIQAKSQEEAVEWAKRCPGENCTIEVRQVFDLEEFPPDVQAAAQPS